MESYHPVSSTEVMPLWLNILTTVGLIVLTFGAGSVVLAVPFLVLYGVFKLFPSVRVIFEDFSWPAIAIALGLACTITAPLGFVFQEVSAVEVSESEVSGKVVEMVELSGSEQSKIEPLLAGSSH